MHEKLKKTKIITKTYWIVKSTYTVSYPDRCTSCIISIDPLWGDTERGGGDISRNRYLTIHVSRLVCIVRGEEITPVNVHYSSHTARNVAVELLEILSIFFFFF